MVFAINEPLFLKFMLNSWRNREILNQQRLLLRPDLIIQPKKENKSVETVSNPQLIV
jgi:hypothetical protein